MISLAVKPLFGRVGTARRRSEFSVLRTDTAAQDVDRERAGGVNTC
jgi:hypothetical protein